MNRSDKDESEQQYVAELLRCYTLLPHTQNRPSKNDRRIAAQLFKRQVSTDAIKTAFLLAISRRSFRPPDASPLEPIRSLAYFLPVVNEVQRLTSTRSTSNSSNSASNPTSLISASHLSKPHPGVSPARRERATHRPSIFMTKAPSDSVITLISSDFDHGRIRASV